MIRGMNKKKLYTLCFLEEFYNWSGDLDSNDLSILKVLNLLFLCVAKNKKLLAVFDNFKADAMGVLEFDVHKILNNYKGINHKGLKIIHKKFITKPIKKQVKKSVSQLKERSPELINYSAVDLSTLSRKWDTWEECYKVKWDKTIPSKFLLDGIWVFTLGI